MNCEELLKILLEYVGGELVIEHHRTVEVHLSECKRCVVLVETYRHTVRFGKSLPKCAQLSATFEARLRAAVEPHLNAKGE